MFAPLIHPAVGTVDVLVPPHKLAGFTGAPDTMRAMVGIAQGPQGEASVLVRRTTESIVREIHPKDYLGEALAIRYWVTERARYTSDPIHIEWIVSPERAVRDILEHGKATLDCDEIALLIATMCLQVGRVAEFMVVGFGAPGDFAHVFCICKEAKGGGDLILDPVAGTGERQMAKRVTTWQRWSLDELPEHGPIESYP